MKLLKRQLFFLYFLLIGGCLSESIGQKPSTALQHVVIKDKVLANTLSRYVSAAKAKVVRITLNKQVDGLVYHLSKISFVDYMEDFPTPFWAEWQGRLLLFYAGPELREVCTITDTTRFRNVVEHSESILPRIPHNPKSKSPKYGSLEGLEWTLKVNHGREIWLQDNQGNDSRNFPQIPD